MNLPRRRFLQLTGGLALPALSRHALADTYPSHPVRWLVGFPPGGATDTVMRIMANWLSERLGQPVVVENRPGAATNLAAQAVATAAPDGHTLLLLLTTNAINVTLYPSLPFSLTRDIAPVCGLAELPLVMVANPSLPAKTVAELIAHAKANPGKINMASFGTGTISHLAGELFKQSTGVNMVHVPYRGGAPMVTDLLAGQVQVAIDALPNVVAHVQRGALRALAVLPAQRAAALPDVPTVGETVPGYEVSTWSGIGTAMGTPEPAIETLSSAVKAALDDPGIKTRLADLGATPTFMTAAAFGALIASEIEKWAKVIKTSGIKPE